MCVCVLCVHVQQKTDECRVKDTETRGRRGWGSVMEMESGGDMSVNRIVSRKVYTHTHSFSVQICRENSTVCFYHQ